MRKSQAITYDFSQWYEFQPKQMEFMRAIFDMSGTQYKALQRYKYIFYGGARGGGKSDVCVALSCFVSLMYPGIQIAFIRETMGELEGNIIPRFRNLFPDGELYEYMESKKWVDFYNGSRIKFISVEHPEKAKKEMGIERQLYIVDEAPNLDESILIKLRGSLRNTRIPNWSPMMIYTGNPGGMSDHFFKKYFISPNYADWEPGELEQKHLYKFIPASVYDNPLLIETDPTYVQTLNSMPKHLREAWLNGNWGVFSGKFFEEFSEQVHVCAPFEIPSDWLKWRSVDLGKGSLAHPSVCGWFAQNPNTGRIYLYREFAHRGVTSDFAQGIAERSPDTEDYLFTMADPNIFAGNNATYDNSQFFEGEGIMLEKADNSRKPGWRNLKSWLHWEHDSNGNLTRLPMMQFFPDCRETIKCFNTLLYEKNGVDDCNSKMFDDPADMVRYATSSLPFTYIWDSTGAKRAGFSVMSADWFDREIHGMVNPIQPEARRVVRNDAGATLTGWEPDMYAYADPMLESQEIDYASVDDDCFMPDLYDY